MGHANEVLAAACNEGLGGKLFPGEQRLFISTVRKFNMQIGKALIIHHLKLTYSHLAWIS